MLVFGSSGAVPGLNDRNTRKLRTRESEVEAGKVKGRHRPHTLSPTSANTTPEGSLFPSKMGGGSKNLGYSIEYSNTPKTKCMKIVFAHPKGEQRKL